jgi:hypothetical protein
VQSPSHSAHIGQEVEVYYRWHPLYGRRVRRHYSEQRVSGQFIHVEAAPGVVTVVAAWMLDPVACAGMQLGVPRVSVAALVELHRLLIERGFRRSSTDDSNIVQEEQDEDPADTGGAIRRPAPAQHTVRFRTSSGDDLVRTRDGARPVGQPFDGGRRPRDGGA